MEMRTLPELFEWPYAPVVREMAEYRSIFAKEPAAVYVGIALWMKLRGVSDADDFLISGKTPIILDRSGILEDNEFMVTGRTND